MNRVSRAAVLGAAGFICLLMATSCASVKTFGSRVIDADTKQPIERAVVVAYWYSERPSILGEDSRLKDLKETLTDKNGNWSIIGEKGREHPTVPFFILFGVATLRYTKEPAFIVFKPGYCSWPKGYSIETCRGKINLKGPGGIMEGKTLELPMLTNREDRLKALPDTLSSSSDDPREYKKIKKKQLEFLRLINEERRNLGLSEYKIYEELKNEK